MTFPISVCPDPSSNLTQIQEVSDWILNAKLPPTLADLNRKLEELKNLAANLPDSTTVLEEAEPQLDTARKLLQDAQDARWASTPNSHSIVAVVHAVSSTIITLAHSQHCLKYKYTNCNVLHNFITN